MKLVCMGDSITEAKYLPYEQRWTTLAAQALPLQIVNHAIHGDTTTGMLGRFQAQVIQEAPDYVFIMGGLNDLWFAADYRTIIGNLFSMSRIAQHYNIAPIIGLPTPMDETVLGHYGLADPLCGREQCLLRYHQLIEGLDIHLGGDGIPCIPMYTGFFNDQGHAKAELFLEDGLHPTAQGNLLLADTFVQHLKEILPTTL